MEQNRDWKPVAALILAGLALLIALGGTRGYRNEQGSAVPQQIIVQPGIPGGPSIAPPSGGSGGSVAPLPPAPSLQQGQGSVNGHAWMSGMGRRFWPAFCLFPLLFLGGMMLLAFAFMRRRRHGWGGPGWYGRPWGGPGPGPQGPPPPPYGQQYGPYPPQYPPQYGQGQGQQYGGYPPQGWYGQPPQQPQQPQQPPQSQSNQPPDANGDITRPEGSGGY